MNQRRVGRNRRVPTGTFTVADDGISRRSTPPGELGAGAESLTTPRFAAGSSPAPNTLIGMTAVPQALLEEARARRGSHRSPPSYEQLQASLSARDGTAIIRPEELQPLDEDEQRTVDADELGAVVQEASSVIDALETPFIGIEDAELDRELRAGTGPLSWNPAEGPVPWEVVGPARPPTRMSGMRPQGLWSEQELSDADLADAELSDVDLEDTEISVVEQLELEGGIARGADSTSMPIELSEDNFDPDDFDQDDLDGDDFDGAPAAPGLMPAAEDDDEVDDEVDEDEVTQVVALARHGHRRPAKQAVVVPDLSHGAESDDLTGSETLQAMAERAVIHEPSGRLSSYPPPVDGQVLAHERGDSTGMVLHPSSRALYAGEGAPRGGLFARLPSIPVLVSAGVAAILLLAFGVWAMFSAGPEPSQTMKPITAEPGGSQAGGPSKTAKSLRLEADLEASRGSGAVQVQGGQAQDEPVLDGESSRSDVEPSTSLQPEIAAAGQDDGDEGAASVSAAVAEPGALRRVNPDMGAPDAAGEHVLVRQGKRTPPVAGDDPQKVSLQGERPSATHPTRRAPSEGPRAEAARRRWSDVPNTEDRLRWTQVPDNGRPQGSAAGEERLKLKAPAARRRVAATPARVLDDEYFFPSEERPDVAQAAGRGDVASAAAARRVEQGATASGRAVKGAASAASADTRGVKPVQGGDDPASHTIRELELSPPAVEGDVQDDAEGAAVANSADGEAPSKSPTRSAGPDTVPAAAEVAAAIEEVRIRAESCISDRHGEVVVDGTLTPDGRVSHALISGPFAGTPEGSCLARAIRTARLAPFPGEHTKFHYRFEL